MMKPKEATSRIMFNIAAAVKDAPGQQLSVDDALIIAATSAVIIDYKNAEDYDLKRIMLAIKKFMVRNGRFLTYTREGVAEGLRNEWLPSLDADDKARMLTEFILIDGVEGDSLVIDTQLLEALTRRKNPDRERYGKEPYVAPAKKTPKKAKKTAKKADEAEDSTKDAK